MGEGLPIRRQVNGGKRSLDTLMENEDSLDIIESGQSSCGKWS